MAVPESIQPLVDKYTYHREAYIRGQAATLDHDKTLIHLQIQTTNAAIDARAYELSGLTHEEIAIMEGGC